MKIAPTLLDQNVQHHLRRENQRDQQIVPRDHHVGKENQTLGIPVGRPDTHPSRLEPSAQPGRKETNNETFENLGAENKTEIVQEHLEVSVLRDRKAKSVAASANQGLQIKEEIGLNRLEASAHLVRRETTNEISENREAESQMAIARNLEAVIAETVIKPKAVTDPNQGNLTETVPIVLPRMAKERSRHSVDMIMAPSQKIADLIRNLTARA